MLILAVLSTVLSRPAHADTLDFTWNSSTWVKSYESPTQFTITGPFTLSGTSTVTFAEVVTGGAAARTLTFGANYGGTLVASGDGTFNGAMTFPTSDSTRSGLAVLTPTADGFTVTVRRAASGPDAGATFVGVAAGPLGAASQASATASASEPGLLLAVAAGLAAAARLRGRTGGTRAVS